MFPKSLHDKLEQRRADNAFRTLGTPYDLVDFSSNDYLGFSKLKRIFESAHQILYHTNLLLNGSTGSRLLTGNHALYENVENQLSQFHDSEAAIIFNSGYDANVGFFSSVPQRGDIILFDEYIHASIRDGIFMSKASSFKFKHNDLQDLESKVANAQTSKNIYVVTESVFSMDGDTPNLSALATLVENHRAYLIIDEAHAVGVFGNEGQGLIQSLDLQNRIFARIVTFGKAIGAHGAVILGSSELKDFLINYSRAFIYTTALPPHSLATIKAAYLELGDRTEREQLLQNIRYFKERSLQYGVSTLFIKSDSAIQSCLIPGNDRVKEVSEKILKNGFNVKPILYPSVPKGQERLRFCIHSYNSEKEISTVLELLSTFV